MITGIIVTLLVLSVGALLIASLGMLHGIRETQKLVISQNVLIAQAVAFSCETNKRVHVVNHAMLVRTGCTSKVAMAVAVKNVEDATAECEQALQAVAEAAKVESEIS